MKLLRIFFEERAPWIVLVLVAVAVRFYGLARYDIWYDEALSVLAATISYRTFYIRDFMAYGYYSLLRFWVELFGTSLFALRSLSAIASVLCVYPLYRFVESFLDKKVAFLATALFVLSPFQIWYAQELRNYSLMTTEAVFFVYALWRHHQTRSVHNLWVALFIFVLGFLTDYRMVPYLLGVAVLFRKDLGRAFWMSFGALLGALVIVFARVLRAQWGNFLFTSFWPVRPNVEDMLITLNNFIFGYIRQPTFNVIMLGLTGLLLAAVIFMSFRDRRLWLVKVFCFAPILGVWLLSQFSVSFYVDRYFIVCSPAWYVLIACFMLRLRRGILSLVAITTLCFFISLSLFLYYTGLNERPLPLESNWYRMHKGTPFKHPVAPVFEFLRDHYESGDMIFLTNSDIRSPLLYYLFKDKRTIRKNDAWRYTYVSVSDFLMESSSLFARKLKRWVQLGECLTLDVEIWPEAKRYWLVSSSWHRGAGYFPKDNQTLVSQYMLRVAERIRSYNIEGVTIELFVRSRRT